MKNVIKDYCSILLVIFICPFIFEISFNDFIEIRYLFPSRPIYMAISILLNYIYLKIVFHCIEPFIRMSTFINIRIGKKGFVKQLFVNVILNLIFFLVFCIASDLVMYLQFNLETILFSIILEIFIGTFMILTFNKFHNNLVLVSLIIMTLVKLSYLLMSY